MPGRVRVYIACSVDGFIAGPDHDLTWLDDLIDDAPPTNAITYENFMGDVGALLMGRSTYDVVDGFDVDWPYGALPVLVATSRALETDVATVRPVAGAIETLVAEALEAASGKDVYLDGGNLIRQAMDAELVDELIVTMAPVILGDGHPLFAGMAERTRLRFDACHRYGPMMQLVAIPTSRS